MSQRDGGDMLSEPVAGNGEQLQSGGYVPSLTGSTVNAVGNGNLPRGPVWLGEGTTHCFRITHKVIASIFGSQVVWFWIWGHQ